LLSLLDFFFFFSSRRRHTRLQGDWSSDVCSSDLDCRLLTGCLLTADRRLAACHRVTRYSKSRTPRAAAAARAVASETPRIALARSEERRVGKEGRSRWSPYH